MTRSIEGLERIDRSDWHLEPCGEYSPEVVKPPTELIPDGRMGYTVNLRISQCQVLVFGNTSW